MPLSTVTQYEAALASPKQAVQFTKNAVTVVAGRLYTLSQAAGLPAGRTFPGASWTTCTRATAGALGQENSTLVQRIVRAGISLSTNSAMGILVIGDRIHDRSGLSGITTGAQTVNSPAHPARQTTGRGVMAAAEIYTTIGATASRVRMSSYTNSDATAGKVGAWTVFGSTGFRDPPRMVNLPLADGDEGIDTIQSVELEATTGTAGDYGITIYRPLLALPFHALGPAITEEDGMDGLAGLMSVVPEDAYLFGMVVMNTTSTGVVMGKLDIAEDP